MEVVCDYREHSCIEKLQSFVKAQQKYSSMQIKTENLSLGDFAFGNIIVERKSHQDLASSILDGRYKEQCCRISEFMQENPNHKVYYFIEGNFDLYFQRGNIDKDKIISCIMSLTYEKGFSVIMTKNVHETCTFLLKFAYKYYTKYNKNNIVQNGGSNESLVKQQKKKNSQITRDNICVLMLSMVPNISTHVAESILKHFDHDIYNILNLIKTTPEELYHITIPSQQDPTKLRKISKNIANTLINYFSDVEP